MVENKQNIEIWSLRTPTHLSWDLAGHWLGTTTPPQQQKQQQQQQKLIQIQGGYSAAYYKVRTSQHCKNVETYLSLL